MPQRIRTRLRDWWRRNIIAVDPHPSYSRLDHADGLHAWDGFVARMCSDHDAALPEWQERWLEEKARDSAEQRGRR